MRSNNETTMHLDHTHHLTGLDDILGALAVLEHTLIGQSLARLLGLGTSRAGD